MGIGVNAVNQSAASSGSATSYTPTGNVDSSNVQAALTELDDEKSPRGNLQLATTGGTTVLTDVQFAVSSIDVFGILTSNVIIEVPDNIAQLFIVDNLTTGAFTVTVKHNLTAGTVVPQGVRQLLYTTGTIVEGTNTGGAVDSVFGRAGAVVAQAGDYNKTDVGLGNVDNTADAAKPVSTAQQTALDGKQNLSLKDAVNGYAGLDGSGLINPAQLPSIAISNTFVVASEVAMLALVAVTGDVAVRSDISDTYILRGTDPSLIGDWELLLSPGAAVTSVYGRAGVITAQAGDYTASQVTNIAAGNIVATTVQAAIDELDTEKAAVSHTHASTDITDFATAVTNHADVNANTTARHTHTNSVALDNTTASFTTALLTKLNGIATSANLYVHPNHTGDVTSTGDGATVIANGAVSLIKMADMATASFIGRVTAGTGVPQVLSKANAQAILNIEDGATADQIASEVPFTPTGAIAAINVQAAIAELDTEKSATGHTHTLASITDSGTAASQNVGTGANNVVQLDGLAKLPAIDGSALTNLPAAPITSIFGRTGVVVATSGDYTWAEIDKTVSSIADITTRSHTDLTDIGTNTHAQIDSHIANSSNPHGVTAVQVGSATAQWNAIKIRDIDINAATPNDGDVLVYDIATTSYKPIPNGSGDAVTTGSLAQFATTTSAELLGVMSDETGTGNLVFSNNPSFVSIRNTGSMTLNRTAIAVSGISGSETIIGVTDTAAPRTVTLQTADAISGRVYLIKDESGGAGTNQITVTTQGAELIDGQASLFIAVNYGVIRLYSDGTNFFTF